MNFVSKLFKLNKEDDMRVYYIDGMMYVNDESDNQATYETSLIEAYDFAMLIMADFDYTATDEEVKELGDYLITLCENEDKAIPVWEYLDSINNDFVKLTNVNINDIDKKRHIVSLMSDPQHLADVTMNGSATFIAKMLNDTLEKSATASTYDTIYDLQADCLCTDWYDIKRFKKDLSKAMSRKEIIIDGSLWINSCKYEYVHKIVITNDEVDIYGDFKRHGIDGIEIIGSIERKNINTICEQHYHENGYNVTTDVTELVDFDIKKEGDW